MYSSAVMQYIHILSICLAVPTYYLNTFEYSTAKSDQYDHNPEQHQLSDRKCRKAPQLSLNSELINEEGSKWQHQARDCQQTSNLTIMTQLHLCAEATFIWTVWRQSKVIYRNPGSWPCSKVSRKPILIEINISYLQGAECYITRHQLFKHFLRADAEQVVCYTIFSVIIEPVAKTRSQSNQQFQGNNFTPLGWSRTSQLIR